MTGDEICRDLANAKLRPGSDDQEIGLWELVLVDGAAVHVVLEGLDRLSWDHRAQEWRRVRVGELAVFQLFWTLVVNSVWLPLVVVLDLAAHAHKRYQRWVFLDVLQQDQVAVLAAEVLGLPHEEDVSTAGLLPLRRSPLLHLPLVLVQALHSVERCVLRQRSMGISLDRPSEGKYRNRSRKVKILRTCGTDGA